MNWAAALAATGIPFFVGAAGCVVCFVGGFWLWVVRR